MPIKVTLSLLLAALSLWPFQSLGPVRLPLLPLVSYLCYKTLCVLLRRNRQAKLEEELLFLIGFLGSELSKGCPLALALEQAPAGLLSTDKAFSKKLSTLASKLKTGLPIQAALSDFTAGIEDASLTRLLQLAPALEANGGQVARFLKEGQLSQSQERLERRALLAEQSSQSSEALLMALMPFAIRIVSGKMGEAISLPLDLASYAAALFLFFLCLKILFPKHKAFCFPKALRPRLLTKLKVPKKIQEAQRALAERFNLEAKALDCAYPLLLEGLLLLVPLSLLLRSARLLLLLLPWALFLLAKAIEDRKKLYRHCQLIFPPFLSLLVELLGSGLSLDKALALIAASAQLDPLLSSALKEVHTSMQSGQRAGKALAQLRTKLPLEGHARLLEQLDRYELEGGTDSLELLRLRAEQSQALYRQALKASLSRRALSLSLPMVLDLLLVLLISLTPALGGFRLG